MNAEPGPAHDELGFTVTEVVCSVVILSLVMGAIATAMLQALRLPDDARYRSQYSVERSFAVQQYSDDVGNATSVTVTTTSSDCPVLATLLTPTAPVPIAKLGWFDGTGGTGAVGAPTVAVAVEYQLQYAPFSTAAAKVAVRRVVTHDGTPFSDDRLLDGFCTNGDTQVLTYTDGATYGRGRIESASFQLRDGPRDGRHRINLQAVTRPQ